MRAYLLHDQGLQSWNQSFFKGSWQPCEVQPAEDVSQIEEILLLLLPTDVGLLLEHAYLLATESPRGFKSRDLMKEKKFSTGAISKWYGPRKRTGILNLE